MRMRTAFWWAWILIGSLACAATPRDARTVPEPATDSADEVEAADSEDRSFEEIIGSLEHRPGLLDVWVDEAKGTVWLDLPSPGEDGEIGTYLYVEGLLTGLGSNPVGLDRGQLGEGRIVTFRVVGGKVLLEEQNLRFRADTDDPLERQAVLESFATSVIWAGPVAARRARDGRILVDFTSFLLSDAHDVPRRLKQAEQGMFRLDVERSAVHVEEVRAFPDNVELEAYLTYTGDEPGDLIRSTAPVANAITLIQHHSFLRLPDDEFRPRFFDPRAGYFGVDFTDYGVPLDAPIHRGWIARHRLTQDEPIVFYLDPGTPEPVRSALLEGASWWSEAFAAAGFPDGYRVEMLPEDVHPLDARYHVIQWVHRSTRGWSYGGGVLDPRTGEIVKAYVTLGSLRVRQDRLLFEGLLGVEETGTGSARDPVELALARIRQLAAHEVGHALGLTHNFAASTYGGRASVMDYPAPWVQVGDDGSLDVSKAYGVGVGAWDVHAIRYGYEAVPEGEAGRAALDRMVRDGIENDLRFVSDEHARPPSAAHPLGSLWDNGADAVEELEQVMRVRKVALDRFGPENLAEGRPLARLHEVLVPIYLYHRYQTAAAVKFLGGLDFRYAVRGDEQPPARPVPAEAQRRALNAVLGTLDPAALDLPDEVVQWILPRPPGHPPNRELFNGRMDPVFDPLSAASSAADLTVDLLLEPHRAMRLVDQHRRDASLPGFTEVVDALVDEAFGQEASSPRRAEIGHAVQTVVVTKLVELAGSSQASPAVRARTEAALRELQTRLEGTEDPHDRFLAGEITRYFDRPGPPVTGPPEAPQPPPGSPIGG